MANIDITRMSSKGQVVIPLSMRDNLKEGDKLIVIRNNAQLILKKAEDFDENIEDDLEFARRTEEAWKRHQRGEFVKMEADDFIEEMKKW